MAKKKGPLGKRGSRKGAVTFAPRSSASNTQRHTKSSTQDGFNYPTASFREQSTMQQQALDTRNTKSHWQVGSRLRDRPIKFISSGFIEPSKELQATLPKSTASEKPAVAACQTVDDYPPPSALEAQTLPNVSANVPAQVVGNCEDGHVSDSSDEVILFKGRETTKVNQPSTTATAATSGKHIAHKPQEKKHTNLAPKGSSCTAKGKEDVSAHTIIDANDSQEPEPLKSPVTSPSPAIPLEDRLSLLITNSDDDSGSDAAIADYIGNMEADDVFDMIRQMSVNTRTLGGTHNDIVVDTGGEDNDEALSQDDEEAFIIRDVERRGIDIDSEDSDEDGSLDQPSDTSACAIDDAQLARLLSKQEELGLGSGELILLDDGVSSRYSKRKPRKKPRSQAALDSLLAKGLRGQGGATPSAEAVADAFDQLAIMAGQGQHPDFGLSDSEMEATLKASWKNDRARKKERKKLREELRVSGLLGKHANPEDPRIKYANGMDFDDLKAEFRAFLVGSKETVSLTPMDANARKVIHELAHRFKIGSKSTGTGDQRRPTLTRKKGTLRFEEGYFNAVFSKFRRRYFPRLDDKRSGGTGGSRGPGGRGGGGAAAEVRNGEVVGGSAPEISQANKGRTMLERMGWSTGMALGAIDNKGMTQPIIHVVKRSKAGLG